MASREELERELRDMPGMVRWFSPLVLLQIARQALDAALFGQYADRRLMQAAHIGWIRRGIHIWSVPAPSLQVWKPPLQRCVQRHKSERYKTFVRMRIKGDERPRDPAVSVVVPEPQLHPPLIEDPIVVVASRIEPIGAVA